MTERELAGDAPWKLIQKNCFTRWANEHLKTVNKHIANLETDLSDGLRLIALVEVLSGKRFRKYNKRPKFRNQKLENVTIALKFLENDEGIKIVNIDSSDIVDSKLKLILGLIWTLILHYSISMPTWEDDEGRKPQPDQTPKQRMLSWVQSKVSDRPVTNFTTDWNDGRALGALVDGIAPGLCPDWDSWVPENSLPNCTEAMDAAEKWLDVPQLIKPAEMCNPNVDELSVMTYLSQFPNARLKQGAPLRPKTNPARVRAYGPGIEPTGNAVGAQARFTVETFSAGRGDLEIIVVNPNGVTEPHEAVFNKDRNQTYSCHYTPTMEGPYTVTIKFAGQNIPKSPFTVGVKGFAGDASKVTASGPGIEKTGVITKERTYFDVFTKNAGMGAVDIVILDPSGHRDTTRPTITQKSDDVWHVEYYPTNPGLHSVNIFFAGKAIPNSPFGVSIAPAIDAKKCYCTGRGVQQNGIRVGDIAEFIVHTDGAGDGELKVACEGPGGKDEPIKVKKINPTTYVCTYEPKKPGEYVIPITYGGQPISKSPYVVDVAQARPTKIRAYGPGLEGGVVNLPATFIVETNGETGALGFSIEGPSQAKIECNDNGDGSANISYVPYEPGEYAVHVLCDDEDIQGSPWMANIVPYSGDFDPTKVKAFGQGVEKDGLKEANQPLEFTVDAREGGKAPLAVIVTDEQHSPLEVAVKDNKDGTYTCRYTPKKLVKHVVCITWGGVVIPGFPVRVSEPVSTVADPSKVRIFGPAFEKPVIVKEPTHFVVDCSRAGPGDVAVSVTDPRGRDVPIETTDNRTNSFNVNFTPEQPGTHQVNLQFADKDVPGCPFKIKALRSGSSGYDASKVKVYGDGVKPSGVLASLPVSFMVDTTQAGDADVEIIIEDPAGHYIAPEVSDRGDGTYSVTYTPEGVGCYIIPVKYGGDEVPHSPFTVRVAEVGDASKVKFKDTVRATIPVGEECVINLDTSDAGQGRITCRIGSNAESDVDIAIVDHGDGTVSIIYTPQKPGAYTFEIKFGGQPIPNGSFTQNALSPEDYKKLKDADEIEDLILPQQVAAVGSARPLDSLDLLEEGGLRPVSFDLPVGPVFSLVAAEITMPSGKRVNPRLKDNKDGTVSVFFTPTEIGLHKLDVTYNSVPIEGSPFQFYVGDEQVGKVTAYGPGLSHGIVDTKCDFTINTKDATNGGLALAIEGPSKAEMKCDDNGDGTCSVSYFPTEVGAYNITVKFADKHIEGSPFTAKIVQGEGQDKASRLSIGAPSEIPLTALMVDEKDLESMSATIKTPSGKVEPCVLKRLDNGQLGIAFTPREAGDHEVTVLKDGKPIPGSPFTIHVSDSEIGNASRVRAYGQGLVEGTTNEINEFTVDSKDAGFGGLSLSVEGPSKADIECGENPDGTCQVKYKPTEPGNYVVNIKFADEHIPGSPFLVKITGEGSGLASESKQRQQNAADVTHVGSECELCLKIPNTKLSDLEASVTNPSGVTEKCDITELKNGEFSIKFVPKEIGVHTVSVKHRGIHIPGSPFQFTVGPISDLGAHKVRAIGPGLERGEVNVPGHFNIYTHEAGAGALSVAMEGPAKPEVDLNDLKDGSCEVQYVCSEPGDYLVTIKFNDQQIPDSPFKVFIAPSKADSTTLSINDLENQVCEINKPASFAVNLGKSRGPLDARVVSPSGAEYEAIVQELDDGQYAVRFVPRENGIHLIHVRQNGVPIHGSPFRVVVGKDNADAAKVHAYGDGLSKGETGEPARFIVNTANAGSGALAVTVDGPSKVQLQCVEVAEGYQFTYTPTAPGDYLVIIKYAGAHIPGSPFRAKITGSGRADGRNQQSQVVVETVTKSSTTKTFASAEPWHDSDASKVKSRGAGLQKADTSKDNTFSVDTVAAGNGMLLVGVMGPRIPCEEVSVRHIGQGQYTVVYRPSERGDHVLVVKWGDQHIPGSPFHIVVQ